VKAFYGERMEGPPVVGEERSNEEKGDSLVGSGCTQSSIGSDIKPAHGRSRVKIGKRSESYATLTSHPSLGSRFA